LYQKKKFNTSLFLISDSNLKCLERIEIPAIWHSWTLFLTDIDLRDEFSFSKEQSQLIAKLKTIQTQKRLHVTDIESISQFFREYQHQKIGNRTKYNGLFQISPSCQLKIKIFSKSIKSNGPKIQKSCQRTTGGLSGTVKSERLYYKIENSNLKSVEKLNIQKGYEYGSSVIPIPKEIEGVLKFHDNRCIKLLGFVSEEKIPRHMSMSNIDVMLPVLENINHLKAFAALAKNLLNSRKLGLARLVIRNKSGPKLVVIIPKEISAKEGKYCFYISQLPTIEDVRQFRFSSLRTSTPNQRNVMKQFISKMQLTSGNTNLNLDRLVMPQTQLLNQRVVRETIAGSNEQNPNQKLKGKYEGSSAEIFWDNALSNQLQIEENVRGKLGEIETQIQDTFDLVENVEEAQKNKKKYWCDVLKENQKILEEQQVIQKMKDHNKKSVPDQISQNYAVTDFNAMIEYKSEDLVDKAVKQMKSIIIDIVKASLSGSHFAKALECMKALRRGCVVEEEPESFNDFMNRIKKLTLKEKTFYSFFKSLKENGIKLIAENEVRTNGGASSDQVENFFNDKEEDEEDDQQKKEQDDEDLLRMMDELE
jgi:ATP-dependent DNA helicase 2 subunit 2